MIECDIARALDGPVHLRALARRLGRSPSYLHRKVHELAKRGVVRIEGAGRRVVITPVRENPLFSCYRELGGHLERERRLGPYSRSAFRAVSLLKELLGPDLLAVHVFGSVAEGRWVDDGSRRSDLDLLVVASGLPAGAVDRARLFIPVSERLLIEERSSVDIVGYDREDLRWSDPLVEAARGSGLLVYGEPQWT